MTRLAQAQIEFAAVCPYEGLADFTFRSPSFFIDDGSSLEEAGERIVRTAWAKISPYEAPKIVRCDPGALIHITREDLIREREHPKA